MEEAREQTESGELTEAERRQAKRERRARRQAMRERKGRRQAKRERKGRIGPSEPVQESAEDASFEETLARRLSRIEEAVATQAERSEDLLEKLDEVLHEEPKSTAEEPAEQG
jgi:hypothetical protein